jgi:hypothetical protein
MHRQLPWLLLPLVSNQISIPHRCSRSIFAAARFPAARDLSFGLGNQRRRRRRRRGKAMAQKRM